MMDSLTEFLVRLKALAPLHIGEAGDLGHSAYRVHSDTLWAALFNVALEQDCERLSEAMVKADFLISSSFPIWCETTLWPRPYLRLEISDDPSARKKWRNIIYVSDMLFKKLIGKAEIQLEETTLIPEGCLLLKEELVDKPACDWLIGLDTTTANVVDRLTSMTDLFDRTDLYVNTEAGVNLGIRVCLPESVRGELEKCLIELGHRGIGGERSSGKGAFELCDIAKIGRPDDDRDGKLMCTLSLYHPTENEVKAGILNQASYDLVVRGGWIDRRGVQKKRLRMLREGSILPIINGGRLGDIVDVRPKGFAHPVYRYGRAYPVLLEDR